MTYGVEAPLSSDDRAYLKKLARMFFWQRRKIFGADPPFIKMLYLSAVITLISWAYWYYWYSYIYYPEVYGRVCRRIGDFCGGFNWVLLVTHIPLLLWLTVILDYFYIWYALSAGKKIIFKAKVVGDDVESVRFVLDGEGHSIALYYTDVKVLIGTPSPKIMRTDYDTVYNVETTVTDLILAITPVGSDPLETKQISG